MEIFELLVPRRRRSATPEEAKATEAAIARLNAFLSAEEAERLPGGRQGAPSATPNPRPATASDHELEWRSIYSSSPALQAEFGRVEAYVAYRRAEASGRIRPSRTAFAAIKE